MELEVEDKENMDTYLEEDYLYYRPFVDIKIF